MKCRLNFETGINCLPVFITGSRFSLFFSDYQQIQFWVLLLRMRISTFVEISVSPYKLRATTFSLHMTVTMSLLPMSVPIYTTDSVRKVVALSRMTLRKILHSSFWTGRELWRSKPKTKEIKILLHTIEYYTRVQVFVGTFLQSLNFVYKYGHRILYNSCYRYYWEMVFKSEFVYT